MTSFLDRKVQIQEAPTLTVDHKGFLQIVQDEKKGEMIETSVGRERAGIHGVPFVIELYEVDYLCNGPVDDL